MIRSKTLWKLSTSCCIAAILAACPQTAQAWKPNPDFTRQLSSYDVVWNEPGQGPADSMPLGNGEIGLNVWTEPNGDLLFYIGKTDAWSEHPRSETGLMKVGLVRVSSLQMPTWRAGPSSRRLSFMTPRSKSMRGRHPCASGWTQTTRSSISR